MRLRWQYSWLSVCFIADVAETVTIEAPQVIHQPVRQLPGDGGGTAATTDFVGSYSGRETRTRVVTFDTLLPGDDPQPESSSATVTSTVSISQTGDSIKAQYQDDEGLSFQMRGAVLSESGTASLGLTPEDATTVCERFHDIIPEYTTPSGFAELNLAGDHLIGAVNITCKTFQPIVGRTTTVKITLDHPKSSG